MNFKRILRIIASLSVLTIQCVQADTPAWYWGLDYSHVNYATSPFLEDPLDPTSEITANLGVQGFGLKTGVALGNWLGIEVQYGTAKESGMQPYALGPSLEVRHAAAFARFSFPFPRTNLYALAGTAIADVNTGAGGQIDRDDTYVAGGLGIDLMATERQMLYFEILRYEHEDRGDDDPHLDIYKIGYKYHFEFAGIR